MWRHLKEALNDFRQALRPGESPTTTASEGQPGVENAEGTPAGVQTPLATLPIAADDANADRGAPQEPASEPSGIAPSAAEPATVGRPRGIRAVAAVGLVVLALVVLQVVPWGAREPADPAVVATYQGGVVTREQLRQQIEAISKVKRPTFWTPDDLKALVGSVVDHEVTRRWAEEKRVDQKDLLKEAMKHATEAIQIADVSEQLHQGRIPVGEGEIQAYYDQNRDWLGESGNPIAELLEHTLHQELLPLKVGLLSRILPIDDSYYLFRIREKQEGWLRPFEEVQGLVHRHLEARKHEELTRQMERDLLDRIQLQVYDSRIQSVLDEIGGSAARQR